MQDASSDPYYKYLQYIFTKRGMRGFRSAFGGLRQIMGCTLEKTITMNHWQLPTPSTCIFQGRIEVQPEDSTGGICWTLDSTKPYEQHFGNLRMITRVEFLDVETIKQEKLGKGWKEPGLVLFNIEGFEGDSNVQKWRCNVVGAAWL